MQVDELTKREAELQRNQLAWKNTKADLERDCIKIKGQIEALQPKLEQLQIACTAEENRKIDLTKQQQAIQQQIADLHTELKAVEPKLQAANAELEAINKLVASRKAGVDAEISQYKQLSLADADEALEITQEALERAENALNDTELLLTSTEGKLEDAQNALSHTFEATDKQNVEIARLQQKEKDLKARIEPLQEVVDGLSEQVKLKNDRLVEIIKEVDEFKVYEAKAWKALRAKDKSLQERATEIERLEVLTVNRQSFLPPR